MAEEKNTDTQTETVAAPQESAKRTPPTPPAGRFWFWGTGRRKKSIARVRIRPGSGTFQINKREVDVYFKETKDRQVVFSPLQVVNMAKDWDIFVNVQGGGFTGQAGAITLGLARAIAKAIPETEHALRVHGLLTRDARMKERKKYGLRGARRSFQFSKR